MGEGLFGVLPGGWEETTLGDVCRRGGGKIQTGPFGSQLHASDYVPVGIPTVMPANIGDNRIVEDGIARVSESDAQRLARHRLQLGDIVYSRRGDVERRALVRQHEVGWLCGTGSLLVRTGNKFADPVYLSLWLGHPQVRAWITQHAVGATMANLNTEILSDVPVVVPPIAEQRAIAGVLGALGDKIESNRRLWSLAMELLEGARLEVAEGNDTTPCSLGDVAAFNASTLKPGPPEAELVYIDIASVSTGMIDNRQRLTWGDAPSRARRGVADGDIIFSTVRPGRRSFSVILDPEPGTVASTGFAVMTPRKIGTAFLLAMVADPAFAQYCETVSQGSAYPAVSTEAMSKYEFGMPSDGTLRSIESELMPVLRRGHRALSENEVLTELRDALLPELLSGRLRVHAAHERVGAV